MGTSVIRRAYLRTFCTIMHVPCNVFGPMCAALALLAAGAPIEPRFGQASYIRPQWRTDYAFTAQGSCHLSAEKDIAKMTSRLTGVYSLVTGRRSKNDGIKSSILLSSMSGSFTSKARIAGLWEDHPQARLFGGSGEEIGPIELELPGWIDDPGTFHSDYVMAMLDPRLLMLNGMAASLLDAMPMLPKKPIRRGLTYSLTLPGNEYRDQAALQMKVTYKSILNGAPVWRVSGKLKTHFDLNHETSLNFWLKGKADYTLDAYFEDYTCQPVQMKWSVSVTGTGRGRQLVYWLHTEDLPRTVKFQGSYLALFVYRNSQPDTTLVESRAQNE